MDAAGSQKFSVALSLLRAEVIELGSRPRDISSLESAYETDSTSRRLVRLRLAAPVHFDGNIRLTSFEGAVIRATVLMWRRQKAICALTPS